MNQVAVVLSKTTTANSFIKSQYMHICSISVSYTIATHWHNRQWKRRQVIL